MMTGTNAAGERVAVRVCDGNPPRMRCAWCGKDKPGGMFARRYCSAECRNAAYDREERDA